MFTYGDHKLGRTCRSQWRSYTRNSCFAVQLFNIQFCNQSFIIHRSFCLNKWCSDVATTGCWCRINDCPNWDWILQKMQFIVKVHNKRLSARVEQTPNLKIPMHQSDDLVKCPRQNSFMDQPQSDNDTAEPKCIHYNPKLTRADVCSLLIDALLIWSWKMPFRTRSYTVRSQTADDCFLLINKWKLLIGQLQAPQKHNTPVSLSHPTGLFQTKWDEIQLMANCSKWNFLIKPSIHASPQ